MILRVGFVAVALGGFVVASSFAAEEPNLTPNLSETRDFLVAGGDGYGTSECLATASNCGRIVANAWCESKGFAKATHYRVAGKDETTASVGNNAIEQAFIVTCSAK
jgi:hypothetical protein